MTGPALHLRPRAPRYRVRHLAGGFLIEIGQGEGRVMPDRWGRIRTWSHPAGTDPETLRRDVDILRAVIALLVPDGERRVFAGRHSARRRMVLEEIAGLASEEWASNHAVRLVEGRA